MIFISSIKPLDFSVEIRDNQLLANESWNRVADYIVYFSNRDDRLHTPLTNWIHGDEWPLIYDLVLMASYMPEWTCLINSDIWVSPDFGKVERALRNAKASCAVSRRYTYHPTNPLAPKIVERDDLGLDIFCGTQEVWQAAAKLIPKQFRIGHSQWDSWMIGMMNSHFGDRFYDFTDSKVIFHPKHGGRNPPFTVPPGLSPWTSNAYGMPLRKMNV